MAACSSTRPYRSSSRDRVEVVLARDWPRSATRPSSSWLHHVYQADWNQQPSKLEQVPEEGEMVLFDLESIGLKKGKNQLSIHPLHPNNTPVLLGVSISITYK